MSIRREAIVAMAVALSACLSESSSTPVEPLPGHGPVRPRAVIVGVAQQLGTGPTHNCVVTAAGTVSCWGWNGSGGARPPEGLADVVQLGAGRDFSCAVTSSGAVRCWGSNRLGEASVPDGLGAVVQVSAGAFHACALQAPGTVACWGNNQTGEATVPAGLTGVVQVSAGADGSCAVTAARTVACWGQFPAPDDLADVVQVSAGGQHACAVTASGGVTCWGDDRWGQATVPVDLNDAVQVAAGAYHTCAVRVGGSVTCWGDAEYGKLAVPAELVDAVQMGAGDGHSCALTAAGDVTCWGWNAYGQAMSPGALSGAVQVSAGGDEFSCRVTAEATVACWGNGSSGQLSVPDDLTDVVQVTTGTQHACAVTAAGRVACWGDEGSSQWWDVPAGLEDVAQVSASAGSYHTCAVTRTGRVACWGRSEYGEADVPADLPSAVQVSAGASHSCAILVGGTVTCWGRDDLGQLTVPAGMGPVVQLSAGGGHTCARTSLGAVSCWGSDDAGQATVPPGLADVIQVSAGTTHTCAVTGSGGVECWGAEAGDAQYGQATPPPGLSGVLQVSAGHEHTCVVLTAAGQRAVECWGRYGSVTSQATAHLVTTSTVLEASADEVAYGSTVTYKARVSPATSSGMVTIRSDASIVGTCVPSNGSCTVTTSALRRGRQDVTAVFAGSLSHAGSKSAVVPQLVDAAPMTLAYSGDAYFPSTTVTLRALLAGPTACAAGTAVEFRRDGDGDGGFETSLGATTTGETGLATLSAASLAAGVVHEVAAVFAGDANCRTATGTAPVVVAGSADAAVGGATYTVADVGAVQLGFNVQVRKLRSGTSVSGQVRWQVSGRHRLAGTVTSYAKVACPVQQPALTGSTCAAVSGSGTLHAWNATTGAWVPETQGVAFDLLVADGGTTTSGGKKGGSTIARSDHARMQLPAYSVAGEQATLAEVRQGSVIVK